MEDWMLISEYAKAVGAVLLASPNSSHRKWKIWASEGWNKKTCTWRGQGARNDPTHYMPLPQPPGAK